MKIHELKSRTQPWHAVAYGRKRYEVRVNDRDFEVGDLLVLRHWNHEANCYGRGSEVIVAAVTHITRGGEWGLPEELCVLGLRILHTPFLPTSSETT